MQARNAWHATVYCTLNKDGIVQQSFTHSHTRVVRAHMHIIAILVLPMDVTMQKKSEVMCVFQLNTLRHALESNEK